MPDLAPDRWPDVQRIYHAAREQEAGARAAFLDEACAGDTGLRAEVDSLLALDTAAGAFLTRPALEHAARAIAPRAAGALAGRQIHGYEIRSLLGAGGMGEVYLARDLRLGRDVALKILERSVAGDPDYLRRFEDEARSASVLNHPNIVTIYGVGDDGDISYIAMERVNGRTLREIIASADLAIPAVLDLAVQLADALAVAHENGIVHRDLKPDNVMVTPEGLLKVLDFGIAKREGAPDPQPGMSGRTELTSVETQVGTILGTVGYMSPEQAEGRRASQASDQFSFGAILYELLTGSRAFERGSRGATLEAIRHDPPEPIQSLNANVTLPLRQLVERCLEKSPAARYASSRDIAAELREVRERIVGGGLSRRQVLSYGATAAAGVAAAGAVGWWFWPRSPRARSLALLPFENTAHDPEIEHLCDGLTDTLILRLGELPGIKVMTHSLVSNYKRMDFDARAFGREIGADIVLTGTVERGAGELMINASVVEVASGKRLWSNFYRRRTEGLQLAQDDIATDIAREGIRVQLSSEDRDRLVRHVTDSAEAYEAFIQGAFLHKSPDEVDNVRARALFEQAIALDPKFARAYTALAVTYATAAIDGRESPVKCWRKSQGYVRQALERDRDLPDAYAESAGYQFFYEWNWEEADKDWGRAMGARNAEMFPTLRVGRALEQWALGRTSDALRLIREVRAVDWLTPRFIVKEAHYLRKDGQLDEAAAAYRSALRADPDEVEASFGLMEIRVAQRRFDDAIEIYRRLPRDPGDKDLDHLLATQHGEDGYRRIEERLARAGLETSEEKERLGLYVAPIDRARCHAQLGETEEAFRCLDDALDVRDPGVVFLKVDAAWRPLREHPRFVQIVKKVRLP